jgi:N-acetylglucosaminyldiphosphoundecaprenol N-acetyl-beta-D-mannosaminyltransferase
MQFIETFGFRLFSDDLAKIELTDDCKICNTISPNSYGLTTKDQLFYEALKKTDYLILDGIYFALAPILLIGKNVKKNQGPDVFDFFIKKMNREYGRVFF